MIKLPRILCAASLPALLFAVLPAVGNSVTGTPVLESTSSGLITFSEEDKSIRVAAVLAQQDEAIIPTLVRFIDAKGNVLKQQPAELRDGAPVIVELTRRDVGARSDLLVRVEVLHKLPTVRESRYPILITTQPIALNGSARFTWGWNGGICGNPIPAGTLPGSSTGSGVWANCVPAGLTDF